MRIHRLEIEAFGPFAEPQVIDFDQLGAQGLFLLNGATGAGKTSILDAVCFALYGSVPGARQDGKRLRSDHAAPAAEPRVVCEFSARGRRFEVSRSPAWERPSKRGRNGTTTQQAKTLLREWVSGEWQEKTSRNDEAGAELADVLGMDREQFTRVVMLPQGDFAAFLRSKAADRLDLLQKLFGTQRFEAVERQVARQAAEASGAVEDNAAELKMLLDRAAAEQEHLGGEHAPFDPAAGEPEAWLASVEAAVTAEEDRCRTAARAAETHAAGLSAKLQEDQDKARRHARLAAAMQRRVLFELAAPQALEDRERLDAHRRAAVLKGQLDAVDAAALKVRSAVARKDHAASQLTESGHAGPEAKAALETVKAAVAVLEASLPDEQRLEAIARRMADLHKERAASEAAVESAAATLVQLRAEGDALDAEITSLEPLAARQPDLDREAGAAAAAVDVVARHAVAAREADQATSRCSRARTIWQDLRQAWLDLREERLANAAGELAAALVDGEPCGVCGSSEHPHPARAARTALSLAQEEAEAREAFEASEKEFDQLSTEQAAAGQALAALAAQGGDADPLVAKERLEEARLAASQALAAVKKLEGLRVSKDKLTARVTLLQEEHDASLSSEAQASSALRLLAEQHQELETELAGLRQEHPSLRHRLDILLRQSEVLQAYVAADDDARLALQMEADAHSALERALPDAGFTSADAARKQLLPASDVVGLETAVADFDTEGARLEELFAAEELVLAAKEAALGELPVPEPELAAAGEEVSRATRTATSLAVAAGVARKAVTALARIRKDYTDLNAAGKEPRERARILSGLAETLRGAGDNKYKMSLNTYVLAARLEQVALAASERLVAMSDGRYTLQHTDARAARGAKSGLGLEVVDEWTGHRRDTSTLSGGESFMASLSLALGLADVVQHEAGGVDIETLFVDEGFGSLDEQALEQVMDALEGLRNGGRVVGLVSHVAEMKQRIGSQLHVVKGRNGSTVRMAEAVPL
ncbi:AAA family ATPase [Paenarthrobacter sp. NCHU4564]|uniref:AAA family ATPase n=1 Tax=Paenarthrobacter sp. NCHU4564 TaxID=3451353 RepID=UPI003F96072C